MSKERMKSRNGKWRKNLFVFNVQVDNNKTHNSYIILRNVVLEMHCPRNYISYDVFHSVNSSYHKINTIFICPSQEKV